MLAGFEGLKALEARQHAIGLFTYTRVTRPKNSPFPGKTLSFLNIIFLIHFGCGLRFIKSIPSRGAVVAAESTWLSHDGVIKWKHFPRHWPFVRGIHRPPVNSPYKGQWRGALIISLIYTWINGWVNIRKAGDLRRHRAHYDVTVMICWTNTLQTYVGYEALAEPNMSFWRDFHHWLHWQLSSWQLLMQPVMKISSKWQYFRFTVDACWIQGKNHQ